MFFSRTSRPQLSAGALVLGCLIFGVRSGWASDPFWGNKMLEQTEIKFGSVAKGADSVVQVRVKNVYQENIDITNLTTGCSCVSWDEIQQRVPLPMTIPTGQTRVLNLRLNTIQYDGERKSKAMIALFDSVHGVSTTVELPVEAYIRRDIVVTPGAVNFGNVDLGSSAERKVEIRYAGRNDWRLMQAKGTNPHIGVTLTETGRGNGLVSYDLLVTLKPDAPIGTLRDQVTMVTDDANYPQISLHVEAVIEADIVVKEIQFGQVAPGQSKTLPVIVRSKKPIKIEALYREEKPNNGALKDAFTVKKLDHVANTVHSLPITINAPNAPGLFEEEFFIQIAGRPQPISFKARGRILEPTGGATGKN